MWVCCPVLPCIFRVCSRVEVTRFLVSVFVERVGVGVDCLVRKVEYSRRVDRRSHIAGLEVEVGAETAACVAAEGYRFAYFYILVGFYEYFRQVAVDCFKTVGVTERSEERRVGKECRL